MKKFSLLKCFPVTWNQSGNVELAECISKTKAEAIKLLQATCGCPLLDATGYAKIGTNTFVVAEAFDPMASNYASL
jgi:hypothetical protein